MTTQTIAFAFMDFFPFLGSLAFIGWAIWYDRRRLKREERDKDMWD